MLVTTKGRYAMRLMVFIAQAGEGQKVALRRVAEGESISLKYLEQLAHLMVQGKLLVSVRGHGGGPSHPRQGREGDRGPREGLRALR